MTAFFRIASSGFDTAKATGVISGVSGIEHLPECAECGSLRTRLVGEIVVKVDPDRGSEWFDTLDYVSYPALIVSERVRNAWEREGIGTFPGGPVTITGPLPKRLQAKTSPRYFYLDGEAMVGALLDIDRSGYIIAKTCATCGFLVPDMDAMEERPQPMPSGAHIFEDTWNGSELFTTAMSPTAYYCTERVVDSIARHGFTGFEIVQCSSSKQG